MPQTLSRPHAKKAPAYVRTSQPELGVMLQESWHHPLGFCTTCLSHKDRLAAKMRLILCCRRQHCMSIAQVTGDLCIPGSAEFCCCCTITVPARRWGRCHGSCYASLHLILTCYNYLRQLDVNVASSPILWDQVAARYPSVHSVSLMCSGIL